MSGSVFGKGSKKAEHTPLPPNKTADESIPSRVGGHGAREGTERCVPSFGKAYADLSLDVTNLDRTFSGFFRDTALENK